MNTLFCQRNAVVKMEMMNDFLYLVQVKSTLKYPAYFVFELHPAVQLVLAMRSDSFDLTCSKSEMVIAQNNLSNRNRVNYITEFSKEYIAS